MSRRGKIGAHVLHSRHDSKKLTEAARAAFRDSFERQVDPLGELPPEERTRRAEHARKAYYASLARLSALSRASKKAAKNASPIAAESPAA
jgi:hypothetical protein